MNNEPKAAMSRNHWDSSMSAATPPAIVRSMNPEETRAMSITGWCFQPKQ